MKTLVFYRSFAPLHLGVLLHGSGAVLRAGLLRNPNNNNVAPKHMHNITKYRRPIFMLPKYACCTKDLLPKKWHYVVYYTFSYIHAVCRPISESRYCGGSLASGRRCHRSSSRRGMARARPWLESTTRFLQSLIVKKDTTVLSTRTLV